MGTYTPASSFILFLESLILSFDPLTKMNSGIATKATMAPILICQLGKHFQADQIIPDND